MPLQIISGNSGSGKSQYIYKKMIQESIAYPEQRFLVLVPEQFNMQTQKRLVAMHPGKSLLNVDVLSFNRLAYRVFQETGGNTEPILEESGKSLVIQKTVWENRKKLEVLGSVMKKPGAVNQMKSLISELMQYGIRPEDMDAWMEVSGSKALLQAKLRDIQQIYRGFSEYLESRYLTTEEVPEALCRVIGDSVWLRNCTVVLDGYTGFTPSQLPLIRELLSICRKVYAVVTLDETADPVRHCSPANLFYMSRQMIRTLTELAQECHQEAEEILWIRRNEAGRFAGNPSLDHLERSLFRGGKQVPCGDSSAIRIFAAATPEQELTGVAEQILYLVREKECCYRDIAVITGDAEGYGRLAERIFDQAGIPAFLDRKVPILHNPLVEYIRSAIDMLVRNFSYESVVRYLRSGMTGFTKEEADELDQYLLALGIRGRKQYEEKWTRIYRGMDPGRMEYMNQLRERFLQETETLTAGLRKRMTSLREKTEVLVHFLMDGKLQRRCALRREYFHAKSQKAREQEFVRIYPAVINLLDKAVEILGEEKMGLTEYQQILDALFQDATLGLIPPGGDQVLVGDMERSRLQNIRVLFLVGANEGIIPRMVKQGGILSEPDREQLKSGEIELAPGEREEMFRQRFYLYLNLTKPSDRLYVSYSRMDTKGAARLPSYLVGVIRSLYSDLPVQERNCAESTANKVKTENDEIITGTADTENTVNAENTEEAEAAFSALETPDGRLQVLLEGLQSPVQAAGDSAWKELFSWFRNHAPEGVQAEQMLDAAFFEQTGTRISKAAARAVYGDCLMGSVTRLEQFAACAYAHFLKYGLKLKERETYEFKAADLGNVLHESLERFAGKLSERKLRWADLAENDRVQIAEEAVDEIVHDYGNTILHSSMRNQYQITRMKNLMKCTVEVLQEQLRRGEFEPGGFEVSFAMADSLEAVNIPLPDGASMKLRGRIDRMDTYTEGDTIYIKVIDYKTGQAKLNLTAVYYGLQLQLAVYLNAAVELQKKQNPGMKAEPAGAFLYHIEDPFRSGEDEEILPKLRMDGLCRAEKEVTSLIDRTLMAGGKSEIIPVAYKKDGTLSAMSPAMEQEEFDTVRRFAEKKVREIGSEIMEGEISVNPYQMKEKNACEYCAFRSVCTFDRRLPGYAFRKLAPEDKDTIVEKMKKEV